MSHQSGGNIPVLTAKVLTDWRPEDPSFWEQGGQQVATRNLWLSIPALLLAFAVWMVWSVVVVNLPAIGFKFTTEELFWLASLPGLSGATLRIFYSFMVPVFGGRRWTAISTASLLLPALGIGYAVQDPATPYTTFLCLALLCGFGGGNFASSMANISFFFPKAQKGNALALNAGLGNLGVSVVQFVVPLIITMGAFYSSFLCLALLVGFGFASISSCVTNMLFFRKQKCNSQTTKGGFGKFCGSIVQFALPLIVTVAVFTLLGGNPQVWAKAGVTKAIWLQNAGLIWVPFITASAIAAWFGMNDLASARASFSEQAVIFRRPHNWIMCILYLGTFGSFIGFSAGFPLLASKLFPQVNVLQYAFLGPLMGAAFRAGSGWVSDKFGGARVTVFVFLVMIMGSVGALYFMGHKADPFAFWGFFASFMVLFAATGVGNASTFQMIPVIARTERQRKLGGTGASPDRIRMEGDREAAAILGFSSAIAAYGAFFIPKSYGTSISITGSPDAALYVFIAFYVLCGIITWWCYARRNAAYRC